MTLALSSVPVGQLRLMTRVAQLYYEQDMKQTEVAEALGVSQTRVSRLLRRAEDYGLIKTTVSVPPGVHTGLETGLEKRYGLSTAVIVSEQDTEESLFNALGAAAAAYLDTTVNDVANIGFSSWSASLLASVGAMTVSSTQKAKQVVQVVGGTGEAAAQMQANRLTEVFAQNLGATPILLSAPGIMDSKQAVKSLLGDGAFTEVVSAWKQLSMVLVGIGSLEPSPFFRASGQAVSEQDQENLLRAGAVGDICLRYLDAKGRLVDHELNERVVGISTTDFLATPRRVAVAGGERKRRAIKASLLGGWITTLITDADTANYLLQDN